MYDGYQLLDVVFIFEICDKFSRATLKFKIKTFVKRKFSTFEENFSTNVIASFRLFPPRLTNLCKREILLGRVLSLKVVLDIMD